MATSVKYPTANTPTTGFNGVANNPTWAYTDDIASADFQPSKPRNDEDAHSWRGFDFSAIPAGSTINSVTVKLAVRMSAANSSGQWRVALFEDVTAAGALAPGVTTAIGAVQYTRATTDTTEYLWDLGALSTEPTLAQLQATNFGVRIEAANGNNPTSYTYEVQYIEVTVDYTESGAETSGELNAGGSMSATVIHKASVAPILNAGGGATATSTHKGSVAVTLNGGGSVTATVIAPALTSVVEVKFGALETPIGNDATKLWIRHRVSSASLSDGTATLDIYEGTTLIRRFRDIGGISVDPSFGLAGWTFSAVEHDSITDWTDLRVRLSLSVPGGEIGDYEVADVWLETLAISDQATAAATLNAGGSVTATVTADHATTGELNAGGSITATYAKTSPRAAELNAGGSVTATVVAHRPVSSELNAGGSVTTTVAPAKPTTGTLNGGGSITATVAAHRSISGELNAGGSVTASVAADHQVAAELNAGGSLVAVVAHDGVVSAELNAGGRITASAGSTVQVTGTLNGGGSITATVEATHETAPTLNGGGSITAAATKSADTTGILNAGGSITAAVEQPVAGEVAAELNAGGSITVTVTANHSTTGVLNAGGSIAPTVEATRVAIAALSAGGSITATVIANHSVSAALSGGGSIAATVSHVSVQSSVLNAGGSVTPTVAASHVAVATLNGGGSITATVTQGGVSTYAELALEPLSDPGVTTDHWLSARMIHPNGDRQESIVWKLMDGTTLIATGQWVTQATIVIGLEYLLLGVEAALITDYTNLSIRLEPHYLSVDSLRIIDIWLEVPYPPPLAVELNAGGSIDTTVVPHKQTRAFPDLGEGLMGPALNGGASISAVVGQGVPGEVSGTLNAGGSITATVVAKHTTTAELNAGGSITATALGGIPGEAHGTLNAGGSIAVAVQGQHRAAAELNAGGSIDTNISNWIDFGRTEGVGNTDDGADPGRTTRDIDLGLTDDGEQPGESYTLQSPGETA